MNEKNIDTLLKKVEKREGKILRHIAWLSFLPALFAMALLYFAVNNINAAEKELNHLSEEIAKAENRVDSLVGDHEKLQKRYMKLRELFQVYDWQPGSLNGVDSLGIEEAKKANAEIIRILDSDEKMNFGIIIRYYVKRIDREKVKTGLLRIGYRDIQSDNNDWYSKTGSNRICFDEEVNLSDVKIIALSLLREGVQIKKISLYPGGILKTRKKANSIEILGDNTLNNEPSLKFDDIISLSRDSY